MNGIDNNNPDERGLLPFPVILAATKGEPDAMKILAFSRIHPVHRSMDKD